MPTVAHVKALIGGARLSVDDHTFETVDPYRREVVARVDNATKEVVARAVATAAAAKPVIAATPAHERAALLRRIAGEIRKRRDQLATAMAREVGKAIADAYREVDRCPETIELSAEEAVRIEGAHIPMDAAAASSGKLGMTLRFPVGTVAAITPYNAPLNLACHKLGPALAAGNPIIIKPAPTASFSVDLLIEACIAAGTPHGWVNAIYGFEAGRYLVADPAIDFISFTGSSAIGAEIRRQAPLKPATLELGGNGSTIVAADADLKTAAKVCATNAMRLAGQSCISVQNIFVHRDVVEKFQQLLLENVAALKVGDPLDSETDLGPVIDVRSADRIVQTLKGATKTGNASILIGGSAHEALVDPTVVRLTKPEGALFAEEIFGPVANVVSFESLSEPVNYINAGRYGLQAGVFTRSIEPALQLAKSLRVGGIIINGSSTWRSDQAPYGGVKDSGAGREGPRFAIREMTEERLIVFNT